MTAEEMIAAEVRAELVRGMMRKFIDIFTQRGVSLVHATELVQRPLQVFELHQDAMTFKEFQEIVNGVCSKLLYSPNEAGGEVK